MVDTGPTRARFPELERRSLVYWAGDKGGAALPLVDTKTTSAVGLSLANASRNQALVRDARARGLGVMLDVEAWRGQLPLKHRMRKSWQPPGLGSDERVDPDAAPFPDSWRHTVTQQSIEAQIKAGATILTTAAHFSENPLGIARANDFALTQDAVAEVDRRRLRLPGPGDAETQPRQLYATIAVVPRFLSEEAIAALVAAYATLNVDGFVVWAFRFGGSKRQFRLMRSLTIGLQGASGKPAVVGGLGQLWKLALASGVAAACFGHQRSALAWLPEDAPKPPKEGKKPPGRGVAVYHSATLGGSRIGRPGAEQRAAASEAAPCDCGHHDPTRPPEDQPSQLAHNAVMTMREAAAAVEGTPLQALTALLARAPEAALFRSQLGMGTLDSAWRMTLADFPDLTAAEGDAGSETYAG